MRIKRAVTAVALAAGLLVSPVHPATETLGIGAEAAVAQECRLEIQICQEFDLVFWKWETCWTYRALCD